MSDGGIVYPQDRFNEKLLANVCPSDWQNPTPASRYNLVVIGAGTAGLVTAAGAAGMGAKVALVEQHLMGGDCLNTGCVPSKCIIRSAHMASDVHDAARFGMQVPAGSTVDFGVVMERMRQMRARISKNDSVQRFQELGIDVFLGPAQFSDLNTIEVRGQMLRFSKAVIATGARAAVPPIPGLSEAGFLTNETVFSLTERPERLAVIGGGPIGCELAQAFHRLGSEVILFHNGEHILNREDTDAADVVQQAFLCVGICLILNATINTITVQDGKKVIHYDRLQSSGDTVAVDAVLVSTGRVPNVDGLNLEVVGVEYDKRNGIIVDDNLQTSNTRIYAAGDVCMRHKFTHAADAAARIVIRNALFMGHDKLSALTVPWCTYTDPEIAHVGMYEHEATEQGMKIDTFTVPMSEVDRAISDGEECGFVKVHVKKGTDKIVGATIVSRHAGDMISEVTLAMVANVGLKTIANVIHPYPTQAEAIKKVADAYNRTRLTSVVKGLTTKWLEIIK